MKMLFAPVLMATAMAATLAAPAFADGHVGADTVLATVNGEAITLGHLIGDGLDRSVCAASWRK